jgi:hypothetical protein
VKLHHSVSEEEEQGGQAARFHNRHSTGETTLEAAD